MFFSKFCRKNMSSNQKPEILYNILWWACQLDFLSVWKKFLHASIFSVFQCPQPKIVDFPSRNEGFRPPSPPIQCWRRCFFFSGNNKKYDVMIIWHVWSYVQVHFLLASFQLIVSSTLIRGEGFGNVRMKGNIAHFPRITVILRKIETIPEFVSHR